ncbi:MAG TPA: BatA and WFA domain-containing protein [bacterium]
MFGLSFLNTLFLWGLAATAIPVIIHLIKRSRAIKLPFAAMRFLVLDPNQRIRSQKLKQLLLLLMRIAALVLMALAFARPFFENAQSKTIWSSGPKAAVILVDNSFSMGYENRFGAAVAKAKELITTFKPGDEVAVMLFSERVETVAETDKDYGGMADQLSLAAQLSTRGTNYLRAIQAAETRLMESAAESKTAYLISDFQASGLDNLHLHWQIQPGIQIELLTVQNKDFSNIAVQEVLVSSKSERSRNRDVLVRIKNYGGTKQKREVTLTLNGRAVSKKSLTIEPQQAEVAQFNNATFPEGAVAGLVEVQSDEELTEDNRFYFVLENVVTSKILAVNGEPNTRDYSQDELFFLERAINLADISKYSLIPTTAQRINEFDFSGFQVILLANVKEISRSVVDRLTYFVRGGGGLIITLGDQVNPTIFNQLFRELSPAVLSDRAFASLNRESGVILTDVDYQHTIFRMFSDAGQGDPGAAQFYQYLRASAIVPEAVLARFDDGGPALLERTVASGKVVLFTSTIDNEWNNLPVKAIFLPLLYQTVQYVAAEKKGQKSYLVGQPVALQNVSEQDLKKGALLVRTPSGNETKITTHIFDQTTEPGIYEIHKQNLVRGREVFAVNVDSRESDLTALSPEDFHSRFVIDDTRIAQTAALTSSSSEQHENRQKLWRLAIMGVLLLLLGETWLANRTYR